MAIKNDARNETRQLRRNKKVIRNKVIARKRKKIYKKGSKRRDR